MTISSLHESQRQLQEQVLQFTIDRHTLELDGEGGGELGSNAVVTIYGVVGEALAQHLLETAGNRIPTPAWRALKILYTKGTLTQKIISI